MALMTCSKCRSKCPRLAVWMYGPGIEDDVFCDRHVPRGCSCNLLEDGNMQLDDKDREFPCCEYLYDEKGFEA